MTDYTPAQMRLIEQHRDINTEHDWWDCSVEQFIEQCKAFGIDITTTVYTIDKKGPDGKFLYGPDGEDVKHTYQTPDVYFSLYTYRHSGCYFGADSFTIPTLIDAGRAVMALPDDDDNAWMRTAEQGVAEVLRRNFERLEREFGVRLLSSELRAVLHECMYSVDIKREAINVDASFDPYTEGDATQDQLALAEALENDWPEVIQEMLRDVATALYNELEAEYKDLQSDDQVWEALEANDMTDEIDEDEESEEVA